MIRSFFSGLMPINPSARSISPTMSDISAAMPLRMRSISRPMMGISVNSWITKPTASSKSPTVDMMASNTPETTVTTTSHAMQTHSTMWSKT